MEKPKKFGSPFFRLVLCLTTISVWVTLLETAIHAPSPHNVQPWRVRIHNDQEADLLIDSVRTLPKEDPTGSFIILTMGMFIEALALLADNQNLKLEYELVHEGCSHRGSRQTSEQISDSLRFWTR